MSSKVGFFIVLCCLLVLFGNCSEFQVGGKDGWVVPKSNDFYNQWASTNRFQINDTLQFKYEKDSVMLVKEEEYEKCKSSRPIFFENDGETMYTFEESGLFFFISGVSGHCDRGQKMIVKVLNTQSNSSSSLPPQDAANNQNNSDANHLIAATSLPFLLALSSLIIDLVFAI